MALFSFGRRDPEALARAERVAALVRTELGLAERDKVTVSEIACGDPVCGGAETVILVLATGQRTRAVKASKSLALITDAEIREAITPLRAS